MKLSEKKVNEIFQDCLLKNGKMPAIFEGITPDEPIDPCTEDSVVFVRSVLCENVFFDLERLNAHEREIELMLLELPYEFMETSGSGGWTFLNACVDKDGRQWADFHTTIDQLLAMGRAIKRVRWMLPRPAWKVLPGGVPYFIVMDNVIEKE